MAACRIELDSTGQNRDDLRGKLLRIDVSGASPYAIPPDNPFRDIEGYAPEIWLLGLRNPWHFSFAPGSQALYITDVGWSSAEEINYLPAAVGGGWNYGWRIFEGDILVAAGDAPAQAADSASEEFVFPIYAYPHLKPLNYDGSFPIGCAIIGGVVYRGEALPELRDAYIFSDYCHGDLWALSKTDEGWQSRELFETDLHITALGEDHKGEIHFTNLGGDLYTLIHAPDHDYDYDSLSNEDDNCPLVANLDQADNWGHVGVGDACDEDFYFNKVDGTEVKMFQQHYGAWHIYACNNSGCGLVANLDPQSLSANEALQLRNEQFGWFVEVVPVTASESQTVYEVSIYDDIGVHFVQDLELVVSPGDLSWRKRE